VKLFRIAASDLWSDAAAKNLPQFAPVSPSSNYQMNDFFIQIVYY